MKKLTKALLILLAALFYYQANAQSIGIKGGLSLANILEKDDDGTYSDDFTMNPGFHLGITVDVPLNGFLSFEPGLVFTTKGMKYENEDIGLEVKGKVDLYYIDIPLTIKASQDLGGDVTIFAATGPYVGIGLSGKSKATVKSQGEEEETKELDIEWGSDEDEDDLRRLDAGLTFGAGVEVNSILIGITYDLGLANISSFRDHGTTTKNRVLKISVGYRF